MATENNTDKPKDASVAPKPTRATAADSAEPKKRAGRPKGSKNKPKATSTKATARKPKTAPTTDEKSTTPVADKPKRTRAPRNKKSDKPQDAAPAVKDAPQASSPAPSPAPTASEKPAEQRDHSQGKKGKSSDRRDRRDRDDNININYGTIETVGGDNGSNQGNKRNKRRRNRRGGNGEGQNPTPQGQQRPVINPEEQEAYAWKIFLGEVTEEGLAFMDDRAASDAARRAFRIAELYLMEAARWANPRPQPTQTQAPAQEKSEATEPEEIVEPVETAATPEVQEEETEAAE